MTHQLHIDSLCVDLGGQPIVKDVSFQLQHGEIGCLLGPSGYGKTTILTAIAVFEPPASGQIFLAEKEVASSSSQLPPEVRRVGMVFQDSALFPHLSVRQTLHLASRDRAVPISKNVLKSC